MRSRILWVPLGLFALLVVVVAIGLLWPSRPTIPSTMIGKPLPQFTLAASQAGKPGVATADFARGKPRLLNVFASWCIPCAAEAPQLLQMAQAGVPIEAVAIRDQPADTADFLRRWGDPYVAIGQDPTSQVQLAIGSSGVPETFVVDGRGVIRHQFIGDIHPEDVPGLMAQLAAAQ